jgi:hypothetical protein
MAGCLIPQNQANILFLAMATLLVYTLSTRIYDCTENQTKPLTEANIEFSLGKRIDEIRFVYDRRSKKAKTENILNNVIM